MRQTHTQAGTHTGAPQAPKAFAEPSVLVQSRGSLLHVTLNRPRVINAFNREMAELVDAAIVQAADSGATAILLDGDGDRGFCGGGDIKAMTSGGLEAAVSFLRAEYRCDYRVAMSPIPVVGVMHGIAMGGGIGLAGHAAVRVVTETSRLAMPETRIGIAPDVGGHLLLARAPGRLGELLAVTSGSMTAGDAIALGFADFFVPSERLPELPGLLESGVDPREAVRSLASDPPASELMQAREWFDPIAERALGESTERPSHDPVGAAQRLLSGLESSSDARAKATAAIMRGVCPVSVAVTLSQLDRTRALSLDLAAVLSDDLRVLARLLARADFQEGVRAQVIDKDGSPKWSPESIQDISSAELQGILAVSNDEEALVLAE